MKLTTAALIISSIWATAATAKDERTFAVLHFTNKQLTIARADPIVNPGKPSPHLHHVLGGSNFGLSSTGKDLLDSNCSTAKIKGDNSNYWFPSLFFKDPKTGKLESVELFYSNVYYFFEATNDEIKPFPVGLQIFTGDTETRSPPAAGAKSNLDPSKGPINNVKWTCPRSNLNNPGWPVNSKGMMAGIQDPINKGEGVGFPDVNCDGYASPLRADIHMPSCYNPDKAVNDYKNNMAWPQNNNGKQDCPKGYIHVPHLFYECYWDTQKFAGRWEQGKGQQPFVLANGDATGYSLHADFMSGWDEKLLQHIIDTCNAGTSGMENCEGLFYGLNKEECTIPPPVDEKVTGVLPVLPGGNLLSGWSYGGTGDSREAQQSSPDSVLPTATPSATVSSATESYESQTGDATTSVPTPPTGKSCKRKTRTVFNTVTVTDTAPASSDTDSATVQGFKYAGCFKDSEKRVLNGKVRPNIGRMSNEKCIAKCQELGFSHAGTEYGGQCYCGNELLVSERLDESQCKMACEDNDSSVCGGSWALSVYTKNGEVITKTAQRRRHMHQHAARHSIRF